jgi:hypothetical protein
LTDPVDTSDPWQTKYTVRGRQAFFSELIEGNVETESPFFSVYRPGSLYSITDRAVVVHLPDNTGGGERIGCGLLVAGEYTGSFDFEFSFSYSNM